MKVARAAVGKERWIFKGIFRIERISEFVDYQLNPLVPKLPSYIKDTTHFLQKLDSLPELPNSCLLVTQLKVTPIYPTKKEFTPAEKLSNQVPTLALRPNPYVT